MLVPQEARQDQGKVWTSLYRDNCFQTVPRESELPPTGSVRGERTADGACSPTVAGKSWCQATNLCLISQAAAFWAHTAPRMCAPPLPPPGELQQHPHSPERPLRGGWAHIPAVPGDPHWGWKVCALLLAGDGSPPSQGPVAVTGFLSVVWLQPTPMSSLRSPRSAASQDPGSHLSCTEKHPQDLATASM